MPDESDQSRLLAAVLYEMRLQLVTRIGRKDTEPETLVAALAYALHNEALAILQGKPPTVEEMWRRIRSVDRRLETDLESRIRHHVDEGAELASRPHIAPGINVVDPGELADAHQFWDWVREHPWVVGSKTVSALSTFWRGYELALSHGGVALHGGTPDFGHFAMWLAAKYGDPMSNAGWARTLLQAHSDGNAFRAFFGELDTFRTRSLEEVEAGDVDHVVTPGRSAWVRSDGESIEQPVFPVVRYRILVYQPEGCAFVELHRTRGEPKLSWLGSVEGARAWCRGNLLTASGG